MPTLPSLPLWPADPPGALGAADHDIPTLTPHLPEAAKATGAAMVVLPGGGYGKLADHEGTGYAEWLTKHGVAAFVVKYRLGSNGYRHPAMLHDAARAMRLTRALAGDYQIDPVRVGIMGSSAGGHLASTLLTHYDKGTPDHADPIEHESSRPDIGILCYPVISLVEHYHQGSRNNLLGENAPDDLARKLSADLNVTGDTPPCFIWHTWEDGSVKVENALALGAALREKGVRFELHVYEKGGHGMGLGKTAPHRWANDCLAWLQEREYVR